MSHRPHHINSAGNFIAGWYLDDDVLCDDLVEFFRNTPHKNPGLLTGNQGKGNMEPSAKDSIDANLPPGELATRYIRKLNEVAQAYTGLYHYSGKLVPWGVIEPVAIQYYRPGGGFKIWHFERDNSDPIVARRHLAFMTYLNTLDDGGGTSFFYQDLTIKAEKGLTLIWPSEWTHTHKGEVSPSQEKYIITGWLSTYTKEEYDHVRHHR